MKIARKITVIALLWLILFNIGSINNIDTTRRMQMTHAWWTGTEEGIPGDLLIIGVKGKNYVPYDLGQSMLMLPGDWLGTKLGQKINLPSENERQQFTQAVVSFSIFLPINLMAVLACFYLLKLFGYSEKLSGLSSIIWLLGTSVLFYSTLPQQNNQVLLFVLLSYQSALAYVIRANKKLAVLSGITLGIAFLIRITSILHAVSVLIFLAGCIISKHKLKSISKGFKGFNLWITGFIPFVLLERILTYYRYGSWTATTTSLHLQAYVKVSNLVDPNAVIQAENSGFSFLNLLLKVQPEALLAPLLSPEKSIFVYDPLLLPCLILLFICWKFLSQYIRWYVIAVTVDFLLHLYIYSWTSEWITDQAEWGSRYHITSIHLLLVPLIPILIRGATKPINKNINKNKNLLKTLFSSLAKVIVIIAMLIQFTSIILPYELELKQQKLGIGSRFRMVQRINNIFYMLDPEPNFQISKVQQKLQLSESNYKITWDLLPFRYQSRLKPNSPLHKFLPILFLLWGLIFILATTTTAWLFIKQ